MSTTKSRLATCGDHRFYLSPTTSRRMLGGYEVRAEAGNARIGEAFTLAAARSMIRQHLNRPRAPVSFALQG